MRPAAEEALADRAEDRGRKRLVALVVLVLTLLPVVALLFWVVS